MVLGASYQLSSGGTGITNTTVGNDLLPALAEFVSLATLFTEFFIEKFEVVFQPSSRYSKPSASAQIPNEQPLVVANLQHGAPLYATHTLACANGALFITNTADPWKVSWTNTERLRSGVLSGSASTASPVATQGWCLTDSSSAALYTGSLQILSPAATPNPTLNFLYGTVVVRWSVSFRSRT